MVATLFLKEHTQKFSPRIMIWGLAILLAFLEFFRFNYSLSTLITFALVPIAIAFIFLYPRTPLIRKEEFEPVLFLLFWLGYSLCSYIWAQDRLLAADYSLLIFRYLFLFMFFSAVFRDHRLLSKLHLFLAFIAFLYIVTGIWEILTLDHLPPSRFYGSKFYRPTGPFYGENKMAAFMLLLTPFLLFLPKLYPKLWVKIGTIIGILLSTLIIIIQEARIAMLAMAAFLLWFLTFHNRVHTWLFVFLLIALIVGVVNYYAPSLLHFGLNMLSREVSSLENESRSVRLSSINIRKQLFWETFDLAFLSNLMGVGGGNYEHYMDTDREFRTAGIINPHNWVLEILGNFGIIILGGFLYIYIKWLYLLYKKVHISRGREKYLGLMYLSSLLLFIATSSLPSSIRWNHLIWIYFAGINAYCHNQKRIYKDNL
jgi:teichuronic acid biosynthesis protein TuaE